MSCRDVQYKLDLYLRGELAPSAEESIESHLKDCEACRQELRRLERLGELLTSAPVPPVPDGLAARVVARAQRGALPGDRSAARQRRFFGRLGDRVRIAAGTAAALAAGFLIGASLGFDTWRGDDRPAAVGAADPLTSSGLQQFVEPGGDSLAQTYLELISGNEG